MILFIKSYKILIATNSNKGQNVSPFQILKAIYNIIASSRKVICLMIFIFDSLIAKVKTHFNVSI